jgi:hypothetical protein
MVKRRNQKHRKTEQHGNPPRNFNTDERLERKQHGDKQKRTERRSDVTDFNEHQSRTDRENFPLIVGVSLDVPFSIPFNVRRSRDSRFFFSFEHSAAFLAENRRI